MSKMNKRARSILALFWVLDTQKCNIDLVLLNGMKEGLSVGFLQNGELLLPHYLSTILVEV